MTVTKPTANGHAPAPARLEASKVLVTLAKDLKPLPVPESLVFGETKTDHMLVINYDPIRGWSVPEIKPYGPLAFDPMASCFHYCPNIFEGMKAYLGANGEARLFRPKLNMERLSRSADRMALPPFDEKELLTLIKHLTRIESRWIPALPGYSLYLRPTYIGTRAALGVTASDSACLYVIASPAGPYFRTETKGISLLAVGESVRSWPGGTGGHKLGVNYAPGFQPLKAAAKQGYDQILWLLDELVTEVGAMNFFLAVQRGDGAVDLITPPLDGTILPGLTRASTITLAEAHNSGRITLPGLPSSLKFHVHERPLSMSEIVALSEQGAILESFGVGTAVIVAPIAKIGWKGKDIVFPEQDRAPGSIAKSFWTILTNIQNGQTEFEGWSVVCD